MKLSFHPAFTPESEFDRIFAECLAQGMMPDQAHEQIERIKGQRVYRDSTDTYQVNVEEIGNPFGIENGDMVHLSIKRVDREAFHDWRVLQRIKNTLVGPECEAFEIYPAESRLVDTSNQYHLFAFKSPDVRIPVGFRERLVMGPDPNSRAKQRPFDDAV